MKMSIDIKHIVALFFLLNSFAFHAQQSPTNKNYYKWFDSNMGAGNISLYNGVNYKEKYRTLNGNFKFYKSSEFLIGNLVLGNQPYYDIEMKYDIFDDQLIVKLPNQSGFNFIQLPRERIVSFNFGETVFVKSPQRLDMTENASIFYEELYKSSSITLYKDHNKIRNRRFLDKGFRYSIFKDKYTYYLFYNDNLYQVKSKRDFTKLFPELKKDITDFYNRNKILSQENFDSFVTMLAKAMSDKIFNNATRI